jgi:hypothetical protein
MSFVRSNSRKNQAEKQAYDEVHVAAHIQQMMVRKRESTPIAITGDHFM